MALFQIFDFSSSTIYLDLVNALRDRGHKVMVVTCTSDPQKSGIEERDGVRCGYVRTPDQFKKGKIRKGLIQLMLGRRILNGVKKYFWNEKVDIIIYPTPPVTLSNILKPLKAHYGALNYLMLKDIFPQNAVDLKMMGEGGLSYRLFKRMERQLYRDSDRIGCMSEGNISYIRQHEKDLDPSKLELFPNTVKIVESYVNQEPKSADRAVSFFFGGNLGKPQAVDFLLKGIEQLKDFEGANFTFIGAGTEEAKVRKFADDKKLPNFRFLKELPRREYEELLKDADIGIVSLSPDFTIPNYPSRILSYMQMGKPVFAVTDRVTDMCSLVESEAGCGYWCPSDDVNAFSETVKRIVSEREKLTELGRKGREYLISHFNVERSADILEEAVKKK